MAKTDLSAALSLVMQRPDVKYSNIGNIVRELTEAGFDPKTAKMAVMMAFENHPDVQYLGNSPEFHKSAGVSAMQAAKAMFAANIDLGQILDTLLEIGYTRDDASSAIDMLNTDEGSQSVTQHTDVKSEEDNAYADYEDPGYEYDDVPPQAIQEILQLAKENKDQVNPDTLRDILEKHNVSSQSVGQLSRELFGKEASTKVSVELAWRDIGLALQDQGISQDQIITLLQQQGASEEEAHAASLPREQGGPQSGGDDVEGPFGAESDNPEDMDIGGDFPYGADMDMEGPGGLNDSLEGAPGPNDFSATGGGYNDAPDDTEDGDFFTEGQDSGQAPEGTDTDFWTQQGQEYVSDDPQMTKTDLMQILQNEGASDEEAQQVADNLELEDDPAIRPGTIVRAGGNKGEVTGVWDTLYGKMASVKFEKGEEYEYAVEDLKVAKKQKALPEKEDKIFNKITKHLSGEWYDGLDALPENYRDIYTKRIGKTNKLLRQINQKLAETTDVGEIGILVEARSALSHEISFCQTRLASADFVGESEYVNSLPKYEIGKEASMGYDFGPGGSESMMLVAEEMEKEAAAFDWNEFSRIASVEFVSEISPVLIGDAQEVARMASSFISERVAGLPSEKAQKVASEFLANVEKARRSFAIKKRATSVDGEDLRMRDDWPLNQQNELPDFWTVMNSMTLNSQDEWVKNKVDQLIKNSLEKEDSRLDSQVANGQFVTEEEVEAVKKQIAESVEDSFGEHFNNNQGDLREEIEDYVREWMLQGPYVQNLIEYNHETGEPTYKDRLSSTKTAEKYPWDKCIQDQLDAGHDMESAKKICGSIKAKNAFVNAFIAKVANWHDQETEDAAYLAEELEALLQRYYNSPEGSQESHDIRSEIEQKIGNDPELTQMFKEIVRNYSDASLHEAGKKDDNFFDVVENLDDMQDEVEEDKKNKKKEKKSFTEDMWNQDKWRVASTENDKISDEGWLI